MLGVSLARGVHIASALERCHLRRKGYCGIVTEPYTAYLHLGFFQPMMIISAFSLINTGFDLSTTLWVSQCGPGSVLKSPPVHKSLEGLRRSPI